MSRLSLTWLDAKDNRTKQSFACRARIVDRGYAEGVYEFSGDRRASVDIITLMARAPELQDAAMEALDVLVGCVVPSGGCDDRVAINSAIASLRAALGDARPLPAPPVPGRRSVVA